MNRTAKVIFIERPYYSVDRWNSTRATKTKTKIKLTKDFLDQDKKLTTLNGVIVQLIVCTRPDHKILHINANIKYNLIFSMSFFFLFKNTLKFLSTCFPNYTKKNNWSHISIINNFKLCEIPLFSPLYSKKNKKNPLQYTYDYILEKIVRRFNCTVLYRLYDVLYVIILLYSILYWFILQINKNIVTNINKCDA